ARQGMQADLAQMDAIIGQFLDYAKPTDAAHAASVNLSGLLDDCAHEAERQTDVRISTSIERDVNIFGNAIDLKRIIGNLVENARRCGKAPEQDCAEITIGCKMDGNHAIVEITDNGLGVPDSELERLLRPFTRLDAARSQANGAGLGLAIVERIV